jgi:hypothetical protein
LWEETEKKREICNHPEEEEEEEEEEGCLMCNLQKSMWVSDGWVIFFLFSFSLLAAFKLLQQHTRYCWLCIKKQRPIPKNHHKHPEIGYQIFQSFECKQTRFPIRRYASSEWIVREKLKFLGFVQTLK